MAGKDDQSIEINSYIWCFIRQRRTVQMATFSQKFREALDVTRNSCKDISVIRVSSREAKKSLKDIVDKVERSIIQDTMLLNLAPTEEQLKNVNSINTEYYSVFDGETNHLRLLGPSDGFKHMKQNIYEMLTNVGLERDVSPAKTHSRNTSERLSISKTDVKPDKPVSLMTDSRKLKPNDLVKTRTSQFERLSSGTYDNWPPSEVRSEPGRRRSSNGGSPLTQDIKHKKNMTERSLSHPSQHDRPVEFESKQPETSTQNNENENISSGTNLFPKFESGYKEPAFINRCFKWRTALRPKTVFVVGGDLTKLEVEVIVNAANGKLEHAGGVAKAISDAAGPGMQDDCRNYVKKHKELSVSESYTSPGFNLPCKYVIHSVGPIQSEYSTEEGCFDDLRRTFLNCMREAEILKMVSIGIPAISSGYFGVQTETVSEALFTALLEFLPTSQHLSTVVVIDMKIDFLWAMCLKFINKDDFESQPAEFAPGQRELGWKHFEFPAASVKEKSKNSTVPLKCPRCKGSMLKPMTLWCGDVFCESCTEKCLVRDDSKCPVCLGPFGPVIGNQPKDGKMTAKGLAEDLCGFEKGTKTLEITYKFPKGFQTDEHPRPGFKYFDSVHCTYLPENDEGRELLVLLGFAFEARLLFTIGYNESAKNAYWQVMWNSEIKQKTSKKKSKNGNDYPDPNHLKVLRDQLARKGIRNETYDFYYKPTIRECAPASDDHITMTNK